MNPELKTTPHSRPDWLDALRGIAACLVVLSHWAALSWVPWDPNPAPSALTQILFSLGSPSVDIFFVLSAYVITQSCLTQPLPVGNYLLWRLTRLLPIAWCGAIFGLIVKIILQYHWTIDGNNMWQEFAKPLTSDDILGFIAYLFPFNFDHGKLNIALWSISVEVLFTLSFIMVFPLFKRYPWLTWTGLCVSSLILVLASSSIIFLYLPIFGLGMIAAIKPFTKFTRFRTASLFSFGVLTMLLSNIFSIYFLSRDDTYLLKRYLDMWGAVLIVIALAKMTSQPPKPLQFLGKISYSLYAVHAPVLLLITKVTHEIFSLNYWWGGVIALPFIFALATLLNISVERLSIKWSRHFKLLNWRTV